jgi:hypothetical protein
MLAGKKKSADPPTANPTVQYNLANQNWNNCGGGGGLQPA